MYNKFYISYEAARLLKEKGYNEKVDHMYDEGELALIKTLTNSQIDRYYRNMYGIEFYGAPTKSEVIDWLESKGIVIELQYCQEFSTWNYAIYFIIYTYSDEEFPTRLEAEDAAIIKALELL